MKAFRVLCLILFALIVALQLSNAASAATINDSRNSHTGHDEPRYSDNP